MKKIVLLIAIFCTLKANAQNYLITFEGTGAATTINTVSVENLTKHSSLLLNGNDVLNLTLVTGTSPGENGQSSEMKIYPNPMVDNATLAIYPPVAGDATVSIYNITGQPLIHIQSYLENSRQEFRLSGLKRGLYLISVKGITYQYSGKLLCNNDLDGIIKIEKISNNRAVDEKISKNDFKGTQATIDMQYSNGDILKFTALSGSYSLTKADSPTQNKTITFNFLQSTDGDNNNYYSMVEIGTQIWMAENLKATKYSNGESIGTTTPATLNISGESTRKYQWAYDGNESNVATYGRLYTWYAATDSRNICPTGWHLPTDAEWTALTTTLGGTTIAGSKLKETGITHWLSSNPATNQTGFTALPGGYRFSSGTFTGFEHYGNWWSVTEFDAFSGWARSMYYDRTDMNRTGEAKDRGLSVRCLKD